VKSFSSASVLCLQQGGGRGGKENREGDDDVIMGLAFLFFELA
jgi:hypothetical protein